MNALERRQPTAFISWAHGDDAWSDTVARFVLELRRLGVLADVDLFHVHDSGVDWSTYGQNAIDMDDFVIIAASGGYKTRWEGKRTTRTGAGAAREANVLKDLFDREPTTFFEKIIIAILPGATDDDVPAELGSTVTRFSIPEIDRDHLVDLLRRLTGQPAYIPNPLGRVPILPPAFAELTDASRTQSSDEEGEDVIASLTAQLEAVEARSSSSDEADQQADLAAEQATLRVALNLITEDPAVGGQALVISRSTAPRVRQPQLALVGGCLMGRRTVCCGLLELKPGQGVSAAEPRVVQPATEYRRRTAHGGDELYDSLVDMILRGARQLLDEQPDRRIQALGIATPGVVEPASGRLVLSVTVPNGSDVPLEVARRLIDADAETVSRAFDVATDDASTLASRILVDNDVRCVARHYLSQRYGRNFACVYVGSGVGAGMVVNGRVYYGANASAGHVGHIDLGAAAPAWSLDAEHELQPVECDCGISGFHFDPMANFTGLQRIAVALTTPEVAESLAAIREAYLEAGMEASDYYRDEFPRLLISYQRTSSDLPATIRTLLDQNPNLDDYFGKVLYAHASILTVGISTLAEIFDPGVLVLCGPLIDLLRSAEFDRLLRRLFSGQVFFSPATPSLTVESHSLEALWRGAALLPCERGFPAPVPLGEASPT